MASPLFSMFPLGGDVGGGRQDSRSSSSSSPTDSEDTKGKPSSSAVAQSRRARWGRAVRAWLSALLRGEPSPVALLMLCVFPLSMSLTSTAVTGGPLAALALSKQSAGWYVTAGDNTCHNSGTGGAPAPLATAIGTDTRFIAASIACIAVGCLLSALAVAMVLRMITVRQPRSMLRLETLYVTAAVLAETFMFYELVSNDALVQLCVDQLGGHSSYRRATQPARYLFWLGTTLTMLSLLGKLAGASVPRIQATLLLNTGTILFGLAASLVESTFAGWLCLLCIAVLCNCFVTVAVAQFLRGAYSRSCDELTRRLLDMLGPLSVLTWAAYPVLWGACALGWVPGGTEQVVWPFLDLLEKVLLSLHMTAGDFSLAMADAELLLQGIEAARQAAEFANQAKRDVMRYLFHEVRGPLNSISLSIEDLTETLASDPPPSATQAGDRVALLAIMRSSASDVTELLDSFLSLEKVESGRLELELEITPVRPLLQKTIGAFSAALSRRELEVTLTVDPRAPASILADPHRLRQCVSNFLSNAIKFSPEGGTIAVMAELVERAAADSRDCTQAAPAGAVAAADAGSSFLSLAFTSARRWLTTMTRRRGKRNPAVAPAAEDGSVGGSTFTPTSTYAGKGDDLSLIVSPLPKATGSSSTEMTVLSVISPSPEPETASAPQFQFLRISVTDAGTGISASDQQKLFSSFVQVRPGAQQQAGGSGLGLAICRRIVELHGGRVGVDSVESSYSCFFLEIPVTVQPGLKHLASARLVNLRPTLPQQPSPALAAAPGTGVFGGPAADLGLGLSPVGAGLGLGLAAPQAPPAAAIAVAPPQPAGAPGATAAVARREAITATGLVAAAACGVPPGSGATVKFAPHHQFIDEGSTSKSGGATPPPLDDGPAGNGLVPSLPADARVQAGGPSRLLGAMVVDDSSPNRLLLARLLRRKGVESVITVNGGYAALAAWRGMDAHAQAALQCVFCDKEMPGDLDGHDTVASLRANGFTGAIIGVSGNALDGDRAAFVKAGADLVLAKPVTGDTLDGALHTVGLMLAPVVVPVFPGRAAESRWLSLVPTIPAPQRA